jgi:hypothetical protein
MNDTPTLKISEPNSKIDFYSFSLPAGWTCPGACLCLAKADKNTGKVTDGKEAQFRCFAASAETIFRTVREARWNNLDILKGLKTREEMAKALIRLIGTKVPKVFRNIIRFHVSGDFFNEAYFQAWIAVANYFPSTIFYGYTKSLPIWLKFRKNVPRNLRLVASFGGKFDEMIDKGNLRFSKVVFSEEEAANYPLSRYWQRKLGRKKGLKIDHDDSLLFAGEEPFALLLHGMQKAGSVAAKALSAMGGKSGKSGYNEDKKAERDAIPEINNADLKFA